MLVAWVVVNWPIDSTKKRSVLKTVHREIFALGGFSPLSLSSSAGEFKTGRMQSDF